MRSSLPAHWRRRPARRRYQAGWSGWSADGVDEDSAGAALDAEFSEHLGYDKHDPTGRNGGIYRKDSRTKTVLTEVGPFEIA